MLPDVYKRQELEQEGFVKNVQGRGCFVMGRGSELMREQLICKVENGLTDAIKAARIATVSYTHLDVYKRQVLTFAKKSEGAASTPISFSLQPTIRKAICSKAMK